MTAMPHSHRWCFPRSLATALLLAITAALVVSGIEAASRQKSVFRSQPTEWNPELGNDPTVPIVFRPAWTFSGLAAPLAGDPVMAEGRLAAAGTTGEVVVIDPADGRTVWMQDLGEPIVTGATIEGGLVLVAAGSGRLHALDLETGSRRWSADLGSPASAPPRSAGGCLLVTTVAPAIVSLDPGSGAILGRSGLPGRAVAGAEPAGPDAIVGTDHGMVLKFEPRTLEVRWRRYLRLPVTAPPLVLEDRVYVAAGHTLRALRLKDGRPRWTARAAAWITAKPFASGKFLYTQCYDNDIYVLQARNGHLVARIRLGHRLVADPLSLVTHVVVAPSTEGSLVGLTLPGLRQAGRFDLGIPGEWFTSAPVGAAGRVAVGYGRTEARILGLALERGEPGGEGSPPAGAAGTDRTPASPGRH